MVVVSKTFTTAETMLNARTMKDWLITSIGSDAPVEAITSQHIVSGPPVRGHVPEGGRQGRGHGRARVTVEPCSRFGVFAMSFVARRASGTSSRRRASDPLRICSRSVESCASSGALGAQWAVTGRNSRSIAIDALSEGLS